MLKRINNFIKVTFLFFLSASSLASTHNINETRAHAASDDSYYTGDNGIDITGEYGDTLLQDLKQIITSSHKKSTSYDEVRTYTKYSDADPDKSGNILLFYANASVSGSWDSGKTWNREHVWPQSLSGGLYGKSGAGSDLHHIRPTDPTINSNRGSIPFGEVSSFSGTAHEVTYSNKGTGNHYISKTVFEPRDTLKGDVARILMYLYTRYYDSNKLKITNVVNTPGRDESDAWDLLLEWNELDPVDAFESNRNDYIYTLQGNRNPYIDHREFADMVFDSAYSGNGAFLDDGSGGGSGETIPVTGISLSKSTLDLEAGQTSKLVASITPSNASSKIVSWSSSNRAVATVSSTGSVTGIGAGNATITASIGGFSATCLVNVTAAEVGEYTKLTSVALIDENADYVLGNEAEGFHYTGLDSWGKIALPSAEEPLIYKLTIQSVENSTFVAYTNISGTNYYMTIPTSNDFLMETSASTLLLGGAQGDNGSICNNSTVGRHLRINGTSGIRSYSSTTGTIVYFYKVESSATDSNQEEADEFLARLTSLEGNVSIEDAITIQTIQSDYLELSDPVKTLVDNGGYLTLINKLLAELQDLYQEEADFFLARLTSLVGNATSEDEETITQIKIDYTNLPDEIRKLVDEGGYFTLITQLESELGNVLARLIVTMNGLSTCNDYNRAPEIRAIYNSLSQADKAIFDATICEEDSSCNMLTKLKYMEMLYESAHSDYFSTQSPIEKVERNLPITLIALFGVLGISFIMTYCYLNKKKQKA